MTHQWKPGDRGRIEFTFVRSWDGSYGYSHPHSVDFAGGAGASLTSAALASAEFVAPAMPKPGEWTGPGLTPIYEVRRDVSEEWRNVTGEFINASNDHLLLAFYGNDVIDPKRHGFGWRRIGDSE